MLYGVSVLELCFVFIYLSIYQTLSGVVVFSVISLANSPNVNVICGERISGGPDSGKRATLSFLGWSGLALRVSAVVFFRV